MENFDYADFMQVNGMSAAVDDKYVYAESYSLILCKYQHKKNNPAIALIFGKIIGYMLRGSKHCFCGSKQSLADECFISLSTVQEAIELLLKDNLILDITPAQYKSKTQVRHYIVNLPEFKKLELTKRDRRKSLNKKAKEEAVQKKQVELFEKWGIKQNEEEVLV